MRDRRAARCVLCFIALGVTGMTACREERVITNHPMFGSLPNAQVNEPVTMPKGYQPISLAAKTITDPKDPNKKVVLASTGRQLMVNIYNALVKQDKATFAEHILSSHAADVLGADSSSPSVMFDELYTHSDDVVELFNRLPMAEYTPGVYLEKVAPSVFRVQLSGPAARDLYYTGFDMDLERGSWHLLRFLRD